MTGSNPPAGTAGGITKFAVLGPVEAWASNESVALGGPKQRALLAVLLLNANEVLSADRLINELWGDEPPLTAKKMVQVYVSRLRRLLEGGEPAGKVLETRPPGYLLRVGPGELDLQQFEALVASGHSALAHDPERASESFRQALSLWRGSPLSDIQSEPFAERAISRLEELRLTVLEQRIEADLAAGKNSELVGELRDLAGRHPLRERLQGQLIVALYRSGRQAEALDAYRRARRTLIEELGIDPSPQLQRLELAILRQDPSLDSPPRARSQLKATVDLEPETTTQPHDQPTASTKKWSRAASENRPRQRALLFRGGLVASSLALVALVVWSSLARIPAVNASSNSVAIVDAGANSLTQDIPVGADPGPIAIGPDGIWVGNLNDRTVTRIDPTSHRPVKALGLPGAPVSLTAGDGAVWIGDGYEGTLLRLLVKYDQLSAPFYPGPSVAGLLAVAVSPGDLWVGLANNSLLRLDSASLRTKATIPTQGRPKAIVVVGAVVWTIQFLDSHVRRIDPNSQLVTAMIALPGNPTSIAAGFGSIWIATSGDDRLWQIDSKSGMVVTSVPLGLSPTAIAVGAGAVWVVGGPKGVVEHINPQSAQLVETLNLGHPIGGIAVSANNIWLTID